MTEIKNGDVSRHCKRKSLDGLGNPTAASFSLRPDEEFVSVNLLDINPNKTDYDLVKETYDYMESKKFNFKNIEVFAKLNISKILKETENKVIFKKALLPHCGIFFEKSRELAIGTILSQNICSKLIITKQPNSGIIPAPQIDALQKS